MKKLLTVLLTGALCMSALSLAVSADSVMGTWDDSKKSENEYSVANHQNGNDYFDYYALGEADSVTLTAKVTIGGQKGFFFGVKDNNGDGQIREAADQYYLVALDGGDIGIERNDAKWGDWSVRNVTGKSDGDEITLKATYKKGSINVFVDGKLVAEYGDPAPLQGKGFGLVAKNDTTFKNVAVDTKAAVKNTTGAGKVKEGDLYNVWKVDGSNYTVNLTDWHSFSGGEHEKFAAYVVGNTSKKVTLTADLTVSKRNGWGGDNGFLFAISDANNDGEVRESGDFYYLVDVSCQEDGPAVGVEKNHQRWGNWIGERAKLDGVNEGDTITLSATYDPAKGTIVVSVNGKEVVNFTDANPLQGTGYALASKNYGAQFKNVKVDVATENPPVVDPGDKPDAPKTGSAVVALSVLSVIALGGVVVATRKREQE